VLLDLKILGYSSTRLDTECACSLKGGWRTNKLADTLQSGGNSSEVPIDVSSKQNILDPIGVSSLFLWHHLYQIGDFFKGKALR